MNNLVIANCAIEAVPGLDIRIENGLISEIGHNLERGNEEVLDAEGNDVTPGLCDHHIHLHALAARCASVECGPSHVRTSAELAAALHSSPDTHGWVRGVGYFESVAGDLDGDQLDSLHGARPVRIQHRGDALWILNTAGNRSHGIATGRSPWRRTGFEWKSNRTCVAS